MSDTQVISLTLGVSLIIAGLLFTILWRLVNKEQRKVNEHLMNALTRAINLLLEDNRGMSKSEVQQIFDKPEEINQEVKKIPILKHSAFKKNEIAR